MAARPLQSSELLTSELQGLLFQSNPEPMWVYEDESLRFLAVNGAAIARYGYSREEFLAMTVADLGPAEDGPLLRRSVPNLPAQRQARGFWRHRTRTGEELWADVDSRRIVYAGRGAWLVTARAVTDRRCGEEGRQGPDVSLSEPNKRRVREMGGGREREYRRCKNGSYRASRTKLMPVEGEDALRRAQEQYRSIFEKAVEGIFQTTADGRYLAANPSLARIYGYESPEELIAQVGNIAHNLYVLPDQRVDFIERMQTQGSVVNFEAQVRRKDGQVIWIRENAHAVRDGDGALLYYEGTVEDVTDRRTAQESLRASEERYRGLVDSSPEAIFVYSEDRFVYANAAAQALFGARGPEELLGRSVFDFVHPDTLPLALDRARRTQHEGLPSALAEQMYVRLDGRVIHVESVSTSITWNGKRAGQVLTRDITGRKAVEAERERLLEEATARADRDPLTGLWNHRVFHKRLKEEDARARTGGTPYAVVLLDLDNFRFFNDAHGHAAGDDLLRRVAAVLQDVCRPTDTLARFGGDEFALLLPEMDASEGEALVTRLAAGLRDFAYRPPGHEAVIPLHLTHGLATYPADGATRQETLAAADARLLHAKTGGEPDGTAACLRRDLSGSVDGFSMLDALVAAVDNKDRYTRRHSEDVMAHCLAIAGQMGLDEEARHTLSVAALLHDVGKIGVPDHILRKPGPLTGDESIAVRQHPLMGSVIVGAIVGLEGTLDAIRHHHERWDGQGYPSGLLGAGCPLPARIMAVADAFSAMTMDRPYRVGMQTAQALSVLRQGAGSQWDPACVEAFLRAINLSAEAGQAEAA